jgi:hypothetical protein
VVVAVAPPQAPAGPALVAYRRLEVTLLQAVPEVKIVAPLQSSFAGAAGGCVDAKCSNFPWVLTAVPRLEIRI